MSNEPEEVRPEPSEHRLLLSVAGWVGVIFIFALIVFIAYVVPDYGVDDVDQARIDERFQFREETEASQLATLTSYAKQGEQITIPVERAKRYVLQSLQEKPVQASGVPVEPNVQANIAGESGAGAEENVADLPAEEVGEEDILDTTEAPTGADVDMVDPPADAPEAATEQGEETDDAPEATSGDQEVEGEQQAAEAPEEEPQDEADPATTNEDSAETPESEAK